MRLIHKQEWGIARGEEERGLKAAHGTEKAGILQDNMQSGFRGSALDGRGQFVSCQKCENGVK